VLIQVTTDNNIESSESLVESARDSVAESLGHYRERLTRVEVHFTDENSHKGGQRDKRCAIEARPAGLKACAASHLADTIDQALDGALDKLLRVLEHTFGKLDDHKGRTPMGGPTG
jgi:ribosome-associated translation inhibitor RaiA